MNLTRRQEEFTGKLFGIENSNRRGKALFGKNQFNGAFPVSLACYMREQGLRAVYISLDENQQIQNTEIPIDDLFGTAIPTSELHFDFETKFDTYQQYSYDDIGVIDLVVGNGTDQLRPLEIKLTVIPDQTTFKQPESMWGSELVIRPASTKYIALGIWDSCRSQATEIRRLFEDEFELHQVRDWSNSVEVLAKMPEIKELLTRFQQEYYTYQKPFLLQPIWKTRGKSATLDDNAFDVFVWSDFALCHLFLNKSNTEEMSRLSRSSARLARILYELSTRGRTRLRDIYTEMAFGFQTDKEFSIPGKDTRHYMPSPRRTTPALRKDVLREIMLNGAEKHLSPERRFDQTVFFTAAHLFGDSNQD